MGFQIDFENRERQGNNESDSKIIVEINEETRAASAWRETNHDKIMGGKHIGYLNRDRVDSVTHRALVTRMSQLYSDSEDPQRKPWYKNSQDVRFAVVFFLTMGYFFIEIFEGMRIGSLALVADAMHMLSDVVALLIGWSVTHATRRQETLKSTYGWTRMEIVGALINGTFMLSVCFNIFIESAAVIYKKDYGELDISTTRLIVISVIGLVLNVVCFLILSVGNDELSDDGNKGSVELSVLSCNQSVKSSPEDAGVAGMRCFSGIDMNMKGVLLHVLGDALGSVAVIVSSLIIAYTEFSFRFMADPICAILIALLIVVGTVPLVRDSASILLQRAPSDVDAERVVKKLLEVKDVLEIHEFHMWSLTTEHVVASLHVILLKESDFMRISAAIKRTLLKFGVDSATIQPEYISEIDSLKGGIVCHTASLDFSTKTITATGG